jgi:hypothetical protein
MSVAKSQATANGAANASSLGTKCQIFTTSGLRGIYPARTASNRIDHVYMGSPINSSALGLLGYPWTFSTIAWEVAISVAAFAGSLASCRVARQVTLARRLALPLALIFVYAAYELVLYATPWVLPSGPAAMTKTPGIATRGWWATDACPADRHDRQIAPSRSVTPLI